MEKQVADIVFKTMSQCYALTCIKTFLLKN